jgi:RNA polymerase sigma factor (TIGR02999 family)
MDLDSSSDVTPDEVTPSEVTMALREIRKGNGPARNRVIDLVYNDLKAVASRLLKREQRDHILTPLVVVHETVIRLIGDTALMRAPNRRFLLAAAARIMRQVLVDHARQRLADRRGGRWSKIPLDDFAEDLDGHDVDVLMVHEALTELSHMSERQNQVVTLRYFGGMTTHEIAAALDVSAVTVERDWRQARRWLRKRLSERTDG